jgi:hypothetical protein
VLFFHTGPSHRLWYAKRCLRCQLPSPQVLCSKAWRGCCAVMPPSLLQGSRYCCRARPVPRPPVQPWLTVFPSPAHSTLCS